MAKSDTTPSAGADPQALREQRTQAEQSGDTAKVADLDRQIRDAESQSPQSGTAQQ